MLHNNLNELKGREGRDTQSFRGGFVGGLDPETSLNIFILQERKKERKKKKKEKKKGFHASNKFFM